MNENQQSTSDKDILEIRIGKELPGGVLACGVLSFIFGILRLLRGGEGSTAFGATLLFTGLAMAYGGWMWLHNRGVLLRFSSEGLLFTKAKYLLRWPDVAEAAVRVVNVGAAPVGYICVRLHPSAPKPPSGLSALAFIAKVVGGNWDIVLNEQGYGFGFNADKFVGEINRRVALHAEQGGVQPAKGAGPASGAPLGTAVAAAIAAQAPSTPFTAPSAIPRTTSPRPAAASTAPAPIQGSPGGTPAAPVINSRSCLCGCGGTSLLGLSFVFLVIAYLSYGPMSDCSVTAVPADLAALEAGKAVPDYHLAVGKHLALYPAATWKGRAEGKNRDDARYVYYPILSKTNPYLGTLRTTAGSGGLKTLDRAACLPVKNVAVIIKTARHRKSAMPTKPTWVESLRGLAVNHTSIVVPSEKKMLRRDFAELDYDKILLVQDDRTPPRMAVVVTEFALGVLFLFLALVVFTRISSKKNA